jgi:trans-AT polyketide synthase/acyltransferase/oxidoreductase domain-containing protein
MKTIFLFSGQGSHYFQMGRELFERDKCFRAVMERLDAVASPQCGTSILDVLYGGTRTKAESFTRTLHSHPAIFMVEYALAQSLIESGVTPDMVLGTSLGSFAAASVAGCIDVETVLTAVIEKARMLEAHCEPGCMIAVIGEPDRYLDAELLSQSELAASNFATHSVISLPSKNLPHVEERLRNAGVTSQRLDVSFAFHSRWIDQIEQSYRDFLATLPMRRANIPIICSASRHTLESLPDGHLWTVTRAPIRFRETIAVIEKQGSYRYLDVGPGGTLATFLKYALPSESTSQVRAVMSPFGSDSESLKDVIAQWRPMTSTTQHQFRHEPGRDLHISENRKMKAIVFPGQGAQFKGMGKEVFPLYPELVKSASDILGYSLEELCLDDPQGQLSRTQFTQPALFAVNAFNYYRERDLSGANQPDFFAGHSLGEYNALHAAGVFSFETGLRLVKKRGELMAAAVDGAMAAVIGITADEIKVLLDKNGLGQIDVANFNSPSQTVIAGSKETLEQAARLFGERNIRCVILNVSAAFHSRHMQAAQAEFAQFLKQFSFAEPSISVIANATARPYVHAEIADTLSRQIASPVRWVETIRYLMGKGELEFQEIGANVLSKMIVEIRAKESPIVDEPVSKVEQIVVEVPQESVQESPETIGVNGANGSGFLVQATALGSATFRGRYGLRYAYMAGAMYRGVASAELVIKMGKAGFLSFFGAGGLSPAKIETAIKHIQSELTSGEPYGMNLLANYEYPAQEAAVVDLYMKHGIRSVEAAAFMQMTPALVRYRLRGLRTDAGGKIICDHRIVAKISRPEVAKAFMSPPPRNIVDKLLEQGLITVQQAELSQRIPVSHDICVEADSGGHTDGGIPTVMLPPLLAMRNEMQTQYRYAEPVCMGLAGGIGGPEAAAAAFLLGADFVMTGSINQCTVEAGMSDDGKSMLQEIDIHDTEYAPAGDMFEIGAQVQVLKKSVFFPSRANKLLSLYRHYSSLDEIPERTRRQIEGTFFKKTFDEVWQETEQYFRSQNMEHEIVKANANPKHKMALVFRWYFAYCTRIAMDGKGEDRVNYQIQTGPALGSFNQWVKGTELEPWTGRHVDQIAAKLMNATAEHLSRSFSRFAGH